MIEEFYEWLELRIIENPSKIVETIKFIDDYCKNNNKNISLLQNIDNVSDFVEFNQKMVSDKNFCLKVSLLKCYDDVNNALSLYCNFLNQRHNSKAKPMIISEILNIDIKDFHKIEEVFKEDFKLGFRINSIIDNDRFKRYYRDRYETEFLLDIDIVGYVFLQVGVFCEEGVYRHYNNIVSLNKLIDIRDFIESSLIESKVVYYDMILKNFDGNLEQIYDVDILKSALYFFYKKEYCFYKDYLAKEANVVIDNKDEIKRLLLDNILPMDFITINSKLPHISIDDIKKILKSNKNFIAYKFDVYTHIDCIDITEDELNELKSYIDNKIDLFNYVIYRDLIKDFEFLFDKNPELTIIGFASLLAYFFDDDYNCKTYMISAKNGDNINYITLLSDYCDGGDEVSLNDLKFFLKSLDINFRVEYLSGVQKNFILINSNKFLNKKNINFDIKSTDAAINNILSGDYITFKQLSTLVFLPNCGYEWNKFLLKSYVNDYSETFRYLNDNITIKKCIGVIIRKDSALKKYDEVLANALTEVENHLIEDEILALDYLCLNGFITSTKYSNIGEVLNIAKKMKEKKW